MKIKYLLVLVLLLVGGLFIVKYTKPKSVINTKPKEQKLYPVTSISHAHGLAIDLKDPNKLYIATHHGLYVLVNEKDIFQVGKSNDDYMGFSSDPKNANSFFSSGHPESGGNIGFQMSEDGGFNWKQLSDGIDGPVDFHAMTVSPVNPYLIFGWYRGAIQRSTDGGKNWVALGNTKFVVVSLNADSQNENVVYAASPMGGFVSRNKGLSWEELSKELSKTFVSTIVPNPNDSKQLLSFSEKLGLAKSEDSGTSWKKIEADFEGGTVLYIAFNMKNPTVVYALTEKNSLFKSTDEGVSWKRVNINSKLEQE
ncbi:MAG: F510_1955 family glycosylhydrolase [Patescibacteria group bacterium]